LLAVASEGLCDNRRRTQLSARQRVARRSAGRREAARERVAP
jgi:hypothetical protein